MAKILLLDGNSLAYRAFFALPADMATASGQVTNAVFGFTSMLTYLLNEQKPDLLAVAFDRPEPTFRHVMVANYKAGRAETPDILRQQMGLVRQVVETLKIPIVEIAGFEADDVIATLATQGRDRGDEIIIVTGDRDSYQLVEDPHIKVLYNKRGVSDYSLFDEAGIIEKTGVHPRLYPQYAALRGDPSDNLPGVPGVGEKTAAKLINDYGSLDGVFANLDKCTPKLRASLEAATAQVRSNAAATPLVRDVELPVTIDDLERPSPKVDEVRQLFGFLEFRSLTDRLLTAFHELFGVGAGAAVSRPVRDAGDPLEVAVRRVTSEEEAVVSLTDAAGLSDGVALAGWFAGAEGRSPLVALAWSTGAGTATLIDEVLLRAPAVKRALAGLWASATAQIRVHKAKELVRSLHDMGVWDDALPTLRSLALDTAVASYLLDPADQVYALEEVASRYAGVDLRHAGSPPDGQLDLTGGAPDPIGECGRHAAAVFRLSEPLGAALEARGLRALYDDVENPLVAVLARMEIVGVRVDTTYLKELAQALTSEARRLEEEVQSIAGERFLVNSVPQLRAVLFDKLGLKTDKKTKTGYSTDAQSLEKLRGTHPIVDPLLRYREIEKLRSTYGESLIAEVGSDGRIHASFNQTVARTGRLSSDQPNLHNIPIRSEEGRQFRRAFIPAEGCELLVADYNQIELRVIAHLAQDPGLISAFTTGQDIHNTTASRVFGVEPGAVTLAMRSKAKMVSYGLAYGMESFGLAQRLNIAQREAQEILDAYFAAFPNVRSYMERAVAEARNKGYTETLFGRRRQIPELQSHNYRVRQAGERQAMNAGIQGLAADIFKVALVRLDRAMAAARLASRLILQVHDEVILEVPPQEREEAAAVTLEAMKGAVALDVPLEVNVAWGPNWAEAKG